MCGLMCLNGPEGRVVVWGLRQGGGLVGVNRHTGECSPDTYDDDDYDDDDERM